MSDVPSSADREPAAPVPLSASHPDLAAEWDDEKNGRLTPDGITADCDEKVYWRCPDDPSRSWRARVRARVAGRQRCPRCFSLAVRRPDLAAEFHPTLNAPLTPEGVLVGNNTSV